MEWVINNWSLLVAAVALIVALIVFIVKFFKEPTPQQIQNLKEWLKYAVIEAEKQLGSGMGKMKLRMVYDMAIAKFPWIVTILSFESFSAFVDEALEWMEQQLSANERLEGYVEGVN